MNRDLGAALTLSILGHGGAVAVIATFGAAWLASAPPLTPPPPALYVDLVHPVITTSERAEVAESSAPRLWPVPPTAPAAPSAPRAHFGAAPAPDLPAIAPAASTATPAQAASVGRDVARPLLAPRAPDAAPPSSPPTAPATQAPAPPVTTVPPAAPGVPATTFAVSEPATSGATDDASSGAWRALGPAPPAPTNPGVRVDVHPPGSTSLMAGPRTSVGSGADQSVEPGSRAPEQGAATAAGQVGPPAAGGGTTLARGTAGEGPAEGSTNGAIPPEYEAYVHALRERVQQRLVYPPTAVRRGQQGVVELELRLAPDGRLTAVEVVAGASVDTLRVAAVAAVRGAAPFPFPPGLAARPLVIRLPVEFRLR